MVMSCGFESYDDPATKNKSVWLSEEAKRGLSCQRNSSRSSLLQNRFVRTPDEVDVQYELYRLRLYEWLVDSIEQDTKGKRLVSSYR